MPHVRGTPLSISPVVPASLANTRCFIHPCRANRFPYLNLPTEPNLRLRSMSVSKSISPLDFAEPLHGAPPPAPTTPRRTRGRGAPPPRPAPHSQCSDPTNHHQHAYVKRDLLNCSVLEYPVFSRETVLFTCGSNCPLICGACDDRAEGCFDLLLQSLNDLIVQHRSKLTLGMSRSQQLPCIHFTFHRCC
jgi:hypothetical protein